MVPVLLGLYVLGILGATPRLIQRRIASGAFPRAIHVSGREGGVRGRADGPGERDVVRRKVIGRTPRGYSLFEALVDEDDDKSSWTRVSAEVGIVGERSLETFYISKLLKDSNLITVSLPRPAGITFSPDSKGFVRVVEIDKNTASGQLSALSRLGVKKGVGAAMIGDILRAVTTTTLDVPVTASLTGELSGVKRRVVLFGVDQEPWSRVSTALAKGSVSDGDLVMVLERPGTTLTP
ncbi:hypothetical protein AAMO2058_001393400 [Amorphochlora amoebiformis]|uniref:Uncharacterized protein n=1 Tax=Amorphochlora amoebiformis TaxID=1561963 RepID=A0A7S0CU55_9EUKA|mmetsp:Transcript_13830/g.21899  ORF Transcript_13830/g.21899 Transcript_13830/m.21899 type:complete len:237 (+) Transcript_13830:259-969(+)